MLGQCYFGSCKRFQKMRWGLNELDSQISFLIEFSQSKVVHLSVDILFVKFSLKDFLKHLFINIFVT